MRAGASKRLRSGHESTSGLAGDLGPCPVIGGESLKVLEAETPLILPVPGI